MQATQPVLRGPTAAEGKGPGTERRFRVTKSERLARSEPRTLRAVGGTGQRGDRGNQALKPHRTTTEVLDTVLWSVTRAQLEHWMNLGLIAPSMPASGSGESHGWSPDDVERLELRAMLVTAGDELSPAR